MQIAGQIANVSKNPWKGVALPPGKTCYDCVLYAYCHSYGMTTAEKEVCDYYPGRFQDAAHTRDVKEAVAAIGRNIQL